MEDLNKSLETSMFSKDAKDLAVDYSELALDNFIDNDVLSEIPIIKTILGIYKTGVGIKERFTLKKVAKFLFRLNNISEKEKADFLYKLSLKESYRNEVFEKLLILLDRLDDMEKAEITGNLFKATIQGKMSVATFYKFASIVDKFYIEDFKEFCEKRDVLRNENNDLIYEIDSAILKNFTSLGLIAEEVKVVPAGLGGMPKSPYQYVISDLGRYLVSYAYPEYTTIVIRANTKF